mmetsp:Transcript_43511/g.144937  ORF Transcript_43511/g.144937 Transcript_43511/m.144937 type:complete len:331 (-) Transcript_43511:34-1026(-)
MQLSHALAGSEPDELRRLFHGWTVARGRDDTRQLDDLEDARDALQQGSGLIGRVLREGAWPASRGGAASQWGAAVADQLPAGGLVLYTTTCGALYAACARSRRARLLLQAIGVAFSEVDLAREGPRGVHALRRLLAAAGASGSLSKLLPVAVLDGRVLGEAGEPGGGARNLLELHDGGELRPLLRDLPSPRPEPQLSGAVSVRDLPPDECLHAGWLRKEGDLFTPRKRRWAVVQPRQLLLFKSPLPVEKAELIVELGRSSTRTLPDYHFEVTTPQHTHLFRVDRPSTAPEEGGGGQEAAGGGGGGTAHEPARSEGVDLAKWVAALQRARS